MVDFVYILDIGILIFILAYRGRQNGILPESFFCIATLISGYAAYINQFWLAPALISSLSALEPNIGKLVVFFGLYAIIRIGLASLGLQVFTQLRTTPFIEPVNKIGGVFFGLIKAIFLASIAVYGLDYLSSIYPLVTEPIQGNSFVQNIYRILEDSYSFIFSILVGT